jgi:hypothetical protein
MSFPELFPKTDEGFYHLTPDGWERRDAEPFPAGRLETWRFHTEVPSDAAKQQVHLERLWEAPDLTPEQRAHLRRRFGYPIQPAHDLHLTIDCRD